MKKFFFSLLVSFLLLFTLSSTASASTWTYRDLPSDSEYFEAFDHLRREGVFSKTLYVRPDVLPNKVDLVAWIVKLKNPDFKPGSVKVNLPFLDTHNDFYYSASLQEAINQNYLFPKGDYFTPYSKVMVGDVVQMLFASHYLPVAPYTKAIPFSDLQNHRQKNALMKAYEMDLLPKRFPQSSSYFGVYQRITKAEVAQMMYDFDLLQKDQDAPVMTPQPTPSSSSIEDPYLKDFNLLWQAVDEQFYPLDGQTPDKAKLLEGAAKGLFDALGDAYSRYYNLEESEFLSTTLSSNVSGIGAYINEKRFDADFNEVSDETEKADIYTVIVSPIKGSPAEEAGLKPGDIILKVNGESTKNIPLESVAAMIRGPVDSEVELLLWRESQELTIKIIRKQVAIPTVEIETRGELIWVQLHQFNGIASSQLAEVIKTIKAEPNIKGMILDLRNNPGGYLNQAVEVTEFFVEPGAKIVTIKRKDFLQTIFSQKQKEDVSLLTDFPLVILLNEGSASASEILAGTLQDNGVVVVGAQSFGKGSIQTINDLKFGAFKLNIAGWYTAAGRSIEKEGVTPDILVNNEQDAERGSAQDTQLNKALEELKK